MKKIFKDILKEIWHSKIRELYIFIMIFLGISTFIGLNMTYIDITTNINNFRLDNRLYDLKIVGHIEENKLKDIEKEDIELESGYIDYFNIKDTSEVVNISSITRKISKPILLKGKLPAKLNEVIINENDKYTIGDEINISKKNKYMEQSLKTTKLKVVGIYESPEYISKTIKEIVEIGNSNVNLFLISTPQLFNIPNNIYRIRFNELNDINITKDKFKNELDSQITKLKENSNLSDKLYYSSILDNASFIGLVDSLKSIDTIKILFPIVFFMVVILVCTTNLTRMISDQRRIIGTFGFLGYENIYIYLKYMTIAIFPTILAIIPSIFVGVYYLPNQLNKAFSADYIKPLQTIVNLYDAKYISIAILLSILCVIISVIISLRNILKESIVELLHGKKEINGNKILLERINIIWNKISFKNKITLRNIFRYKGRMILSIVGISGCASLMFLGFGIKEAYVNIVPNSRKIRKVDYKIVYTKDNENILKSINDKYIVDDVYSKVVEYKNKNINMNIIFKTPKTLKFIDSTTNKEIYLDNESIFITKKLAEQLNIHKGEYITIDDVKYKVGGIVNTYISNYIYLTNRYYNHLTNKTIEPNTLLINKNGSENIDSDKLYKKDNVVSIFNENILLEPINTVSTNLNAIIIIISILSIVLSLVVSLNLMSINIAERKKEISTLKVLGFYDRESTIYIYKEILIINILSIFLGFVGGHYLLQNIVSSLKETSLVLVETYNYKPFTYTAILIVLFTIIIGIILNNIIRKINMVEALKIDE